MNAQAMDSVHQFSKHSGTELLVMLAIARHENYKTGDCYPKDTTIARYARVSAKTVQRTLPKLEESGELTITGGYGTGERRRLKINLPKVDTSVQISCNCGHGESENVHKYDSKVDIAMSTNDQMSRMEKLIVDMSQKIVDIENKIVDMQSEKVDIESEKVDIAMSTEERSIRSIKKREEDRTRTSPKSYQGFESLHEAKNDEVISLEVCIKGLVRNPNDYSSINAAANLANENNITCENLIVWFSGKDCWWFTKGHGKKDGNLPYAKNILNDMLAAKYWYENLSKSNGHHGQIPQDEIIMEVVEL